MTSFSQNHLGNYSEEIKKKLWISLPNPSCNGGTSWWINSDPEPVLIDCPSVNSETIETLRRLSQGRSPRILLTSRESHGNVAELQAALGWSVLLQEQEAYLLPGLDLVESFSSEFTTISGLKLLWTPGPTPGSCVVYAPPPLNVLFCGRLLIPVAFNKLTSVRTKKTFHWSRQQKSLAKLLQWIPRDRLPLLASGGNLNLLGEEKLVPWSAWEKE